MSAEQTAEKIRAATFQDGELCMDCSFACLAKVPHHDGPQDECLVVDPFECPGVRQELANATE